MANISKVSNVPITSVEPSLNVNSTVVEEVNQSIVTYPMRWVEALQCALSLCEDIAEDALSVNQQSMSWSTVTSHGAFDQAYNVSSVTDHKSVSSADTDTVRQSTPISNHEDSMPSPNNIVSSNPEHDFSRFSPQNTGDGQQGHNALMSAAERIRQVCEKVRLERPNLQDSMDYVSPVEVEEDSADPISNESGGGNSLNVVNTNNNSIVYRLRSRDVRHGAAGRSKPGRRM